MTATTRFGSTQLLGITSINMKIKIPAKTVEACDLCKNETSALETCTVCGKQFCYMCHPYLPGCMIQPHVCKECDDREDVKKLVERYSHDFVKIFKLREKALARLPKARVMPNIPS